MKGTVIYYNQRTRTGVIRCENATAYNISDPKLLNTDCLFCGESVSFNIIDNLATDITVEERIAPNNKPIYTVSVVYFDNDVIDLVYMESKFTTQKRYGLRYMHPQKERFILSDRKLTEEEQDKVYDFHQERVDDTGVTPGVIYDTRFEFALLFT